MNTRCALASSLAVLGLTALAALTACSGKVGSATDGTSPTNNGGGSSGLSDGDGGPAKSLALGTYSSCVWLAAGNTFQGEGLPTSTFTLAANGDALTGTFVSGGVTQATLALVATSAESATATKVGQGFGGNWGYCGAGVTQETLPDGGTEDLVSDPAPSPATLNASAVDVTVAGDSLFLTMTGPVIDVTGFQGCQPNTPSPAPLTAVLECDTRPGADASAAATTPSNGSAGSAIATPTFAPGLYDCTDSTDTVVTSNGVQDNASVGGAGTLTLTKNGAVVSATLAGDEYLSGTFDFDAVSGNAAIAPAGQMVHVACGAFSGNGPASDPTPTATNVTTGSLTTDGTTLTLIALGNVTTGSCSGQTSTTVLTCTAKN